MIGREAIVQILDQYAKHGWRFRRVLLSEQFREQIPETADIFEGVEIKSSALNGLWFSRSSRPGITAWELRHLSTTPYALVENIADSAGDADVELMLKRVEAKMIEVLRRPKPGH